MNSTSSPKLFFPALFLCLAVFALAACREAESEARQARTAATENEELARQYIEAYNAQDRAALGGLLADSITMNGEDYSREDFLTAVQGYWNAFPDIEADPTHVVGADNHVTVRMMGRGTGEGEYLGYDIDGREIEGSEIVLFRVTDGQFEEYWAEWDELGFWEQLGVLESPYPEE